TPTSDAASAAARGSSGFENRVLPPTSGLAEPSAGSDAHSHRPAASSRRQWRAGNQRRSMRALRTLEPFGSSTVEYRTGDRSPSVRHGTTASNAARSGVGLPFALEMTAPRGTPAAPKM